MLAELSAAAFWKSKAKLCISDGGKGAGRALAGELGEGEVCVVSGVSL